jgi:hypothetical protein
MSIAVSGRKLALGGVVAGLGGLISIVGAFLPAENATLGGDSFSTAFWDGNAGKTICVVSIVALAIVAGWLLKQALPINRIASLVVIIVAGLIVMAVAGGNYGTLSDDISLAKSLGGSGSIGIGLYLDLVGGILLVAGGVLGFVQKDA